MSDEVLFTIVLRHIGGELKTLPVEFVAANAAYLSIRWGQSGIYDLNLARNTLTARSIQARRKGRPLWVADDIDAVRAQVAEFLGVKTGNTHQETEKRYAKHLQQMPRFQRCIVEKRFPGDEPEDTVTLRCVRLEHGDQDHEFVKGI